MFHHYLVGWAPGTGFWVGFFCDCVFTGLFYRRALFFVLLGRSYLTMLQASQPCTGHSSPSPRVDSSSPLLVNVGACGGGRLNRRLQRREQGKSKQI